MTEDTAEQQHNPHWIAAMERLKSAGVSNVIKDISAVSQTPNYPYQMPPAYPPPMYSNHYASVPMPSLAPGNDQLNWYPPAPPPQNVRLPPYAAPVGQQNFRPNGPITGGNSVPFSKLFVLYYVLIRDEIFSDYSSLPNNYRQQGFRMSLPRTQRPAFTNPLATAPANEVLGDPDSGFCIRGKHPASLKFVITFYIILTIFLGNMSNVHWSIQKPQMRNINAKLISMHVFLHL